MTAMFQVIGRSSLIVAHTIGLLVAGIAAVFAIRTIVLSGLILCLKTYTRLIAGKR